MERTGTVGAGSVRRGGGVAGGRAGWRSIAWLAAGVLGCSAVREGTEPVPAERTVCAEAPAREFVNSLGMRFVLVPAGEFLMGSPEGEPLREADEGPVHRVRITRPFYMGATEVTQAQWTAVMGSNPSAFRGGALPVEHVSWHDAVAFAEKLSAREGRRYRLPTEAEWEYACRAGSQTPFSSGGALAPDCANCDFACAGAPSRDRRAAGGEKTTPAGALEPNAWGLHDMHGNVYEWCSDWYDAWYYGRSPVDDPPGGKQTSQWTAKILRGGAFYSPSWACRSAARHRDYPAYADDFYGLRLVAEEPPPPGEPLAPR